MNPIEFQRKWIGVELKERSTAQEHFLDLCRVLGNPTPAEMDPHGDSFMFERGAAKAMGGNGWEDIPRFNGGFLAVVDVPSPPKPVGRGVAAVVADGVRGGG